MFQRSEVWPLAGKVPEGEIEPSSKGSLIDCPWSRFLENCCPCIISLLSRGVQDGPREMVFKMPQKDPTLWYKMAFGVLLEPSSSIHSTTNIFLAPTYCVPGRRKWQPTRVLAWRIPGTGGSSMGSQRVGHDWSGLAAAALCARHCSSMEVVFKVLSWGPVLPNIRRKHAIFPLGSCLSKKFFVETMAGHFV